MARKLTDYHRAWLSENPSVEIKQLRAWLKEGFDIHHLDGDHANNSPNNLVLIWGPDHMMLHNGKKRMARLLPNNGGRRRVQSFPCGCHSRGRSLTTCKGETIKLARSAQAGKVIGAIHAFG